MTDDRMALLDLIEKNADTDLVRAMLAFAAERLMTLEVENLTGAPAGARSPERLNHRTAIANGPGTPGQAGLTSPSPSCARALTSRPSWSHAAQPRRRSRP